jgi:hypothetical protein
MKVLNGVVGIVESLENGIVGPGKNLFVINGNVIDFMNGYGMRTKKDSTGGTKDYGISTKKGNSLF